MRGARLVIVLIASAACASATPNPSPGTSASAAAPECPPIAAVRAFVVARDRADGASAAALFTSDGFIDGPVVTDLGIATTARGRLVGSDQIKARIDSSVGRVRSVEIADGPQGCGAETTWTERRQPVNPGQPTDFRAKASTRDGKIASITYTEVSR